jgi:hypothetical protein
MDVECPKCKADISDTYEGADPSVGIMCGGWYCDACDHAIGEHEVGREHFPDDVQISFAREPGEPIGTPLSELSNTPGTPGHDEFKRIAKTWGYD